MSVDRSEPGPAWPERCRRRLLPSLDELRRRLERHLAGEPVEAPREPEPAAEDRAAFDLLVEAFELDAFEARILLLCAGVELDARVAELCAELHGDPRRRHASFALAMAALPGAHWTATVPGAPLRRWRLLRLEPGEGLSDRGLRIEERILHYLVGVNELDGQLRGSIHRMVAGDPLSPSQTRSAERAAAIIRGEAERGRRSVLHLAGGERRARLAVAKAACAELGLELHLLRDVDLPADPGAREELADLWAREAVLTRGALLIEAEGEDPRGREALRGFLDVLRGPALLAGGEAPQLRARKLVSVEVRRPSPTEQRERWRAALPGSISAEAVDALVGQFSLSSAQIDDLAAGARARGLGLKADELWDAARERSRTELGGLARRIEVCASWEQLILPAAQRATLKKLAVHVRQRQRVYERWGFAERSRRGLGISALFAGPSGTGKTMAAEVLADELRLDLVHVDLSSVVSKYIGETEKNLARIFDAADRGGAILLFDEADALFGRRSEVKDSHDRHANIEVSYLLQRIEAYRGLAILTTNLEANLDPAFLRRIRFVVRFAYPDRSQRAEIWRTVFPARTPTDGLDVERLGRLDVPGGNIRNIALRAAFLAAEEDAPVAMHHLADAARSELRKIGRTPPERELRGWR